MLVKPGPAAAAMSGKIGGIVFAHNRGGQYARTYVVPTDPATAYQEAVRTIMAGLVVVWNDVLTPTQREDWATYAENVPMVNRLGDPINIGALGHYIRSNVPRLQAGLDRVDAAPSVFNLGDPDQTMVATVAAATDDFSLAYDDGLDWCDEDGSALLIYASRPRNPSINFFKGPYRFTTNIDGDSVTPPTTPEAGVSLPFACTAGQRIFFRGQITRADGRLSESFRFSDDAA